MADIGKYFRAILSPSFLVIMALTLLFLYSNAAQLYTQDAINWKDNYLIYLLFFAITGIVGLVVAPKVLIELAKASYWKAFLTRFIPAAAVSVIIFAFIKLITSGFDSINPLDSLQYVPFHILVFHVFVVAQVEEIMFRGVLFESIASRSGLAVASVLSSIVFAGFHFYSSGGSAIIMLTYIPLGLLFTYIKLNGFPLLKDINGIGKYFQATRYTQQANAGVHFAWNYFVLGFVRAGA